MTSAAGVQAWIGKCAVTELVANLSAAVDRGDKDVIIDCYAKRSYDDHGGFKGSGPELAEMICAPPGCAGRLTIHHLPGQSVFDVHDDEAWGETSFVMHALIGGDIAVGYGRYIDYFRRTDDAWKLAYRRVVPDATIPATMPPSTGGRAATAPIHATTA
jgi:SnoaL-like domain